MASTHTKVRGMKVVRTSWISDAGGDASETTPVISGRVMRVVTNPGGAAAPTDDYDVVINDVDGVDVMAGALADRDTADTEQVIPDPPVAVDGALTVVVSNAGNAKDGDVVIYYQ